MASSDTAHISLDALWKYRAEKMRLTPDEMTHLYHCDECLSTLRICQSCNSIDEAQTAKLGRPKRPNYLRLVR